MTESVLIFIFGCFCATLVALLIMPFVWRRAGKLATRRTEQALPLSLNEIQAEKDHLRAEFAITTRKLEMSLQEEREKSSAKNEEIGRMRESLREIDAERARMAAERTRFGDQNNDLAARLAGAEEAQTASHKRISELQTIIAETEKRLQEIDSLQHGASLTASEQKLALAARETELTAMQQEVAQAARERRLVDQRLKEAELSRLAALQNATDEKTRASDVDGKNTRMLGILADRDDALSRREREVERLRAQLSHANASEQKLSSEIDRLLVEKSKLETQLGDQTRRDQKSAATLNLPEDDRARLEARIATLLRENRRLRNGSEPTSED